MFFRTILIVSPGFASIDVTLNFIWSFAVISTVRASPAVAAAGAAVAAGVVEAVAAAAAGTVLAAAGASFVAVLEEAVVCLPQPTISSAAQRDRGKTRIFMARATLGRCWRHAN